MSDDAHAIDEYGRLAGAGAPALVGLARGPVIPPPPEDHHPRSPGWPPLLRDLLRDEPRCLGCGRPAATGHHVIPFARRPDLELVRENVVPVCLPCHFVVCHAGDWRLYVKRARALLAAHRRSVAAAEAELKLRPPTA